MPKSSVPTHFDKSREGREPAPARVAVLMCTYNGAQFVAEQIRTILEQTFPLIDVYVSDDGSHDGTIEILQGFQKNWSKGRFELLEGPRRGFAENFRSLLTNRTIEAEFFAFSDQDDHWHRDHISSATTWLDQWGSEPALHCGRTQIIDANGQEIGFSPLFARPPCFENALVQSIAGANTMTMNRVARELVAEASDRTSFVTHDWWCYQVIAGAGGHVRYAPSPTVGYRQHSSNVVGQNASLMARYNRFRKLLAGQFSVWNDQNLSGLLLNSHLLTKEAAATISQFQKARSGPITRRLRSLRRSRVFRQTRFGELGLYLACVLGKL